MDTGIDKRIALVAGSTSGLGLAVARALAAEGANVVLSGRRGDVARAEAARLSNAVGVEADLTRADAAASLVTAARDAFGEVDILVLNAGGPPPGPAATLTPDAARAAFETLLVRQMELVAEVLPGMRQRGWGRIVAIGSSGVQQPLANLALSNLGRASLAAYLKTLSREVAADGVTVNMVLPGRIDTDRVGALDRAQAQRENADVDDVRARSQAAIPVGRYGRPEEFASVVTFLCGAPAGYVTGEQIRCDGGLVGSY
jgi:3-oxoacyl-[acyl-carrier protein] reductase